MTSNADSTEQPTPPALPAFVGAIDATANGRISGWAVTITGERCDIAVVVNDKDRFVIGTDQPRPDLAAKQQSKGLGGWRVDVSPVLQPGENRIAVVFPDGSLLPGTPITYDHTADPVAKPASPVGAKAYIGAIDTPQEDRLRGWSVAIDGSPAPVTIQVNDGPPVTVEADGRRQDLAAKNLSNGLGGWHLEIGAALVEGRNGISVRFPDGSHVPGSPIERWIGERPVEAKPVTARPAPSATPAPARKPAPVAAPAPATRPAAAPAPRPAPAAAPKPAPAPVVAPAPQPAAASATVTELPKRAPTPARLPSLTELDELSLDDVSLAVASGRIRFDPPAPPAPAEAEPVAEPEAAAPELPAPEEPARPGLFARLFGRR